MGVSGSSKRLFILLINVAIHVVSSFSTTEPSAYHEVKTIAGSSVELPCDIDINSCPSDLHSIKVYKNGFRVYVYVRHNKTEVEADHAEGDLIRPVPRAKLNLDVDPPVITVHQTYLSDEGTYRCDVTYVDVQESCRTAAYTKLFTLSKPTQLEMKFDGGIAENNTRIGSFVEGTQLSLSCEASGAKPPAQITWWNKTERFGADADDEGQQTASTINVKLTRHDLYSRFVCQAMNEALQVPMVTWVDVDVHVRPLNIRILPLEAPIVEGKRTSLICETVGARPAASIEWFNGTRELSSADGDDIKMEEVEENGKDGTLTTRSTYSFTATKHSNGVEMRCTGQNSVMESRDEEPLETMMQLDVQYAPRVSLQPEKVLKINSSASVELICTYESNPRNLSKIVWLRDGLELDLNEENYFETFKEIESDETDEDDDEDDDESDDDDEEHPVLRIKSVSFMDKGIYSCQLTNDVGSGDSITTLELDVYFPPVSDIELDPELVNEHEDINVTLTCNVITANPTEIFAYRWLRYGNPIAETVNDTFILIDVDRDDVANYSCMALNSFGWGFESDNEELKVQYLPGPSTISYYPPVVVKDAKLRVKCNTEEMGYPPATEYRWFRGNMVLKTKIDHIVIESVTTQMLSNFTCAAVNPVGMGGLGEMTFTVMAPPRLIEKLVKDHGELVGSENVSLTCVAECVPRCTIHWLKNDELLKNDSSFYYIKSSDEPANIDKNIFDSVISTLYWKTGPLRRYLDDAEYMCITSDNFVGRTVNSTTDFRVEYPPENVLVSPERVNVTENNTLSDIHCFASGFPEPSYIWTKLNEENFENIVSDQQTLSLNFPIRRNQSGEYTCKASNRHGVINDSIYIDVLYAPTCDVTKEIQENGVVLITCNILDANPHDLTYEWIFNGGNVSDSIDFNDDGSVLSFKEKEGLDDIYGNYSCAVRNSIGVATCFEEITSEGSWLEKVARNKDIFMWAAIIAALLLVVAIIVLYFLCRRKSAAEDARKLNSETRQNPEGIQNEISQVLHQPAVTFRKCEPSNRLTRVKYIKNDSSTPADGKKKKASLPRDGDKAFYENLPFHGLQPPPNKRAKPVPAPRKLNAIPNKQRPVYENMTYFPKLLVQPMFKKDKSCSQDLNSTNVTNQCPTPPTPVSNDGIIYADLQLANGNKHQIIRRDTPTEYAVLNFTGKNDSSEA